MTMTCTQGDFRPRIICIIHRGESSIVQVRTFVTSRPAFPAARPAVVGIVTSAVVAMCSPRHRTARNAESSKGATIAGGVSYQLQAQPFTRSLFVKLRERDHCVDRQVLGPRLCSPGLKGLHAPWECLIAAQHARPNRATLDIRT